MEGNILKTIALKQKGSVYVYDGAKIQQQYKRLITAFKGVESLRINYAC